MNWQASFKTPDHVRREWAEEHGLKAVASERYTAALDAVCTRLGVSTGGHLSHVQISLTVDSAYDWRRR